MKEPKHSIWWIPDKKSDEGNGYVQSLKPADHIPSVEFIKASKYNDCINELKKLMHHTKLITERIRKASTEFDKGFHYFELQGVLNKQQEIFREAFSDDSDILLDRDFFEGLNTTQDHEG